MIVPRPVASSGRAMRISILAFGLFALTPTAHAQLAVIDSSNLTENLITAAQMLQAVAQLKAQLTQLEATYAMLTNPQNILNTATGLESSGIENPMPSATALSGLLGGSTTPSGAASTYYSQNHVYSPTDGSADSEILIGNAQSIANVMGMAAANLQAIQTRLSELPDLETDLNTAGTITNISVVRGRIEAESNFVQAQQAQATNLQVLASAQQQSVLQQQQELKQEDYNNVQTMLQATVNSTN
jgi:Type IV secretion system proteins